MAIISSIDRTNGMYRVLSGIEFNELYPDIELYKLLARHEIHNGYQFKTGTNVDTDKFDPIHGTQGGGIYFTQLQHISRWISYRPTINKIRFVTIPDDAIVCIMDNKLKADRIVLSDSIDLSHFFLELVKYDGLRLQYVPVAMRTREICIEAVKQNGHSLEFVPKCMQSFEICCCASSQKGLL